jgi:hypothetical protein
MKLSEELIIQTTENFFSYIEEYLPDGKRKTKLIDYYKSIELLLATAPASSNVNYHNCFAGGYVEHVNRVVQAALVLNNVWDRFGQEKNYTIEELVFSAINHDLGKLGTNEVPHYIPNSSEWHVKNQGKVYTVNPAESYMDVPTRSIFRLQQAGIEISENEYLSILLHDGLYSEANKPYLMAPTPETQLKTNLPHIIHQADLMASKIEKTLNK